MHDRNTPQEDPRVRHHRSADVNRAAMSPSTDGCGVGTERLEGLSFGRALDVLKAGGRVARAGWNGRNQFVQLQVPDIGSRMSRPYLFIRTVDGELVPWVAAQTDLLACDWCVVTERVVLQYGHGSETLKA